MLDGIAPLTVVVAVEDADEEGVEVAEDFAELPLPLLRLFLRQPPPTGTLRRAPPRVQYRRQVLQKCRG